MLQSEAAGKRPQIAYVLDPRFPGGTSSAVAAELEVVRDFADIRVFALSTAMFEDQGVAPQLDEALNRLKLPIVWDATEIAADIVVLHNPSCLKHQDDLGVRLIARHLIVVTHENFLRPGGAEGFDVAKCLTQIQRDSLVLERHLAPVSAWNRSTVTGWIASHQLSQTWTVLPIDWFNICEFDLVPPTVCPADRRGRHSRSGFEKFPSSKVMELCFSPSADRNVILGADAFLLDDDRPSHWTLYPFRGLTVSQYFEMIDFMIYFTAPTWRESFGRVIAEATAAGKLVITDPDVARTFDGTVVAAEPENVDKIVQGYIDEPDRYVSDVRSAQRQLKKFSPATFRSNIGEMLTKLAGGSA